MYIDGCDFTSNLLDTQLSHNITHIIDNFDTIFGSIVLVFLGNEYNA